MGNQAVEIKVLIIDDSLVFREKIREELTGDKGMVVVGTAEDPFDARDKILELSPHVLVLDVEMPKMNGIEFLKKLMPQYPVPVVVVSSEGRNAFEAMNAGAVDFVKKPDAGNRGEFTHFISELIVKIKIASIAKVGHLKTRTGKPADPLDDKDIMDKKVIAVGASTGGTETFVQILQGLPCQIPGIVVVQHMPPLFTNMYAQRLNEQFGFEVKEAQTGDTVERNKILIAPGGYHMKLVKTPEGYAVKCFEDEAVNGHRPSVDVLFRSVAEAAGENAIGIILTGMGKDGAQGLLEMRKKGAATIGQDEKTSVVYGMPRAAYEIGAVAKQVSLDAIPKTLYEMCCKK